MFKESKIKSKILGNGQFCLAILLSTIFLGWTVIFKLVYPLVVVFILVLTAFIISRWAYHKKEKVLPYVIADTVRIFMLSSIFIIFQLSFPYPGKIVWFCSALLILFFVSLVILIEDDKNWETVLKKWENCKKIDLQKGAFDILSGNFTYSNRDTKVIIFSILIIPVIALLSAQINNELSENTQIIFIRGIVLVILAFFTFVFSKNLSLLIKLFQLEKKLNITFVTEYILTPKGHKPHKDRKYGKI